MQEKTTGIVLHTLKYSDSSSIVTIYTAHFGRISYMVYGMNKKKAVCRAGFFQPLSIVELDVNHAPLKELQQIKDIRTKYAFSSIPFHPVKNALALFIAEILFRTLRQSESDQILFAFLENSIQQLDLCDEGIANFHLIFLLKLSRYLGFEPNMEEEVDDAYFDLLHGVFTQSRPQHTQFLQKAISAQLAALLKADYGNLSSVQLSRSERSKIIESLVEYYQLHIPEVQGLQSLPILQSLFD